MSVMVSAEYIMARRATISLSRTSFWFALGLILMTVLMIAFFPTVRENAEELEDAYSGLSEELLEAFGFGSTLDLGTYSSFMNAEMLSLVFPITVSVFAIMQGAATVAKEVETGTVSLWLSIPVERWRLLLGKIIALALGSVFISATTTAATGIGSIVVDGDMTVGSNVGLFIVLLGYMIAVGGIAVGCSSFARERGRAGAYAAAIVLTCYMMKIVASFSSDFRWVRYLSLFTAYQPLPALQDGTVPAATIILYLIGIAGAGFGLIYFQRRDIVI